VKDLFSILVSDIAPIFVIAAVGYLIERRRSGSAVLLSSLSFNALSPCLVFTLIVTSSMSAGDTGRMASFSVLLTVIMGIAALALIAMLHLKGRTRSSFLLVVMFSNSGNYALPVILFAFGRESLSFAGVNFVTSAILVYTAGIVIATHEKHGLRRALSAILRVPAFYALSAALAVVVTGSQVPAGIMRPVQMLSDAAIPMMILGLGTQLKRASLPKNPAAVFAAVGLSLLVAPLVGTGLAALLGLTGAARATAILVSAMPAAVVTTVLAMEFELDSPFVTSVVFLSTLLSPVTLVLLIAYLKH